MDSAGSSKTAKLILDGKQLELPIIEGTEGERALDISPIAPRDAPDHPGRRFRQYGSDAQQHHVPRRRQRHPAVSRVSDRAVGAGVRFPGVLLPADLRRAADPRSVRVVPHRDSPSHDAARGPSLVVRRLSARCAPDGHLVVDRQRVVAPSIRTPWTRAIRDKSRSRSIG